ncbi:hypothetical protein BKA70DRAFT_1223600 [Coprinopsis sp. MPI-PUGE-AT-0042]|nr:hypothetical protein BKA70DRAFT_1223600 [Coprinopsis sp. MPI-PUGE-AT-0042]
MVVFWTPYRLLKKWRLGGRSAPGDASTINSIMAYYEDEWDSRSDDGDDDDQTPLNSSTEDSTQTSSWTRRWLDLWVGVHLMLPRCGHTEDGDPYDLAERRIQDCAALVKRGILPLSLYSTDPGVVPSPGTVYHSHLHHGKHKGLKPRDCALNLDGTGAPTPGTFWTLFALNPPVFPFVERDEGTAHSSVRNLVACWGLILMGPAPGDRSDTTTSPQVLAAHIWLNCDLCTTMPTERTQSQSRPSPQHMAPSDPAASDAPSTGVPANEWFGGMHLLSLPLQLVATTTIKFKAFTPELQRASRPEDSSYSGEDSATMADELEAPNLSARGGKEGKSQRCPHCADLLRGHPKPLCSQLLCTDLSVLGASSGLSTSPGIKIEGEGHGTLLSPADIPVLSRAYAGDAPLTPSTIRESIRIAFAHWTLSAAPASFSNYLNDQGQSISTWGAVARASHWQEEPHAEPTSVKREESDMDEGEAESEVEEAPLEAVVTVETPRRPGGIVIAFIKYFFYFPVLTMLRVAWYLADKMIQAHLVAYVVMAALDVQNGNL